MRDPDLVQRAERAALALERAWDRWRTMHGFGPDPLPPVSSYVGYSLEEPWGQPRVVFGVDAEEAEVLAALLDGHDCVGPIHAEVTASSEWRHGAANGMGTAPWPLADQLSIPAQAPQPGSEMLPTARMAEMDPGPAVQPGSQHEVPEFQLEVHHIHAHDAAESATSTSPAPDVLEPGSVDGAAASPGAAATDGVSADSFASGKGPSSGGKAGGGQSGGGSSGSGRGTSSGRKAGRGSSGSGSSGSGKAGSDPAGGVSSDSEPSGGDKAGGDKAGGGQAGSVSSGSVSSGSGPSGSGGGPHPAAATEANRTSSPPLSAASQPKLPATSAPRILASGHSDGADALAIGPERGPQAAPVSQGQPRALPQPGTLAFRPQPESLRTSQQAEPTAPTTNSDDLPPSQAPGHRGPRYQGYPPQYQDGPDPSRAPKAYAAAPVADNDLPAPASQPERGKSRQVSRLGRTRRQGPGAHEAWGSSGDQTATDHAV